VVEDGLVDGLVEWLRSAQALGFVGPGDVQAHVAHADAFVRALGQVLGDQVLGDQVLGDQVLGDQVLGEFDGRALDLGTGAGIPGLVLALRWPGSRWVLLDARQRRAEPLAGAVEQLGLASRVEVRCQRAEEAGRDPRLRESFDLVVARSFAAPGVTAECGAPFLAVGGHLAVSEPPEPPNDGSRWPAGPLAELGLSAESSKTPQVQVLTKVAPTAADRPRRVGIPAKRPLF
jgi:16S rRNA (guanine527-N7)-methyltransferase